MIKLKPGVKIQGVTPEMVLGTVIVYSVMRDLRITSILDGKHGRASLHLVGNAIDIGIRDISAVNCVGFVNSLKGALGELFDVVLESDHIHIEYQPKV